jgi:hypothetical protein
MNRLHHQKVFTRKYCLSTQLLDFSKYQKDNMDNWLINKKTGASKRVKNQAHSLMVTKNH